MKVNADTTDPVEIALRSVMKGEFLEAFSGVAYPIPGWQDAELVIYGSTLMRQLTLNEGAVFPLSGIKSSDIDICVMETGVPSGEFRDRFIAEVAPVIKRAIAESGFGYLSSGQRFTTSPPVRATSIDEILGLSNLSVVDDFFVTKTFSPEQMHGVLRYTVDYNMLKNLIPTTPLEVRLVLGVNSYPPPILLNSRDTRIHGGYFKRSRTLDMLAGKITRSMSAMYKAADFIDIYNLLKGHYSADGRPCIDLDPRSPNNVIDALRVLIVAHLAIALDCYGERNLLSKFEDTPENRKDFIENTRGEIASHRLADLERKVGDIFYTINRLLAVVMDKRSEVSYDPLNLTEDEKAFLTEIDGYRERSFQVSPAVAEVRLGPLTVRKSRSARYRVEREQIEPCINVDLLRDNYPDVFTRYPELGRNIRQSGLLNSKVYVKKYGCLPDEIPLDG